MYALKHPIMTFRLHIKAYEIIRGVGGTRLKALLYANSYFRNCM